MLTSRIMMSCSLLLVPGVSFGADWWSIPDTEFVTLYGDLAVGDQKQQSQFAWMAFARVNQQVSSGSDPEKHSQWEIWPSDLDTFSPNVARFELARKMRPRPHLQPLQQLRMSAQHAASEARITFPQAGQEVTRNLLSYNYIMDKQLNTQKGIATYLGMQGATIEFPLGVVETKAWWVRGAIDGAHQFAGLSLTALHLMIKVRATPGDPFIDDTPSWFWTTFELKSNKGLAAAQKLITYADVLPPSDAKKLMQEAGLGNAPFTNYVSNGPQIRFFDQKNKAIVLGNTQLEWPFATPPNHDPATWTKWSTSCHSCHSQASARINGSGVDVFGFTEPVGALSGDDLPPAGYRSYDFVWALSLAQ